MDYLTNSTALNLRVCNEHPYLALPEQCMVCAELAARGMNQGSDMAGTANVPMNVFPDLDDDVMTIQPYEMTPIDFAAQAFTMNAPHGNDQMEISDTSFSADPLAPPELDMNAPHWFDQTDIGNTSFTVNPLAAPELDINAPHWFDQTDIGNTSFPVDPLALPELDMNAPHSFDETDISDTSFSADPPAAPELDINAPNWFDPTDIINTSFPVDPLAAPELDINAPHWFDQTDIINTSFPVDPLAAPDLDMISLQAVADWVNDSTLFPEGGPLVQTFGEDCSHAQDPVEDDHGYHYPEQLANSPMLQSKSPLSKGVWEEATARLESDDISSNFSDDSTSCDICMGFHSEEGNKLIFCQGCEITVHQECYFVTEILHGDWFCRACQPREWPNEESARLATEDRHGVMNDKEDEQNVRRSMRKHKVIDYSALCARRSRRNA